MSEYIDFKIPTYEIVDILLVLHKQGVRELAITKEDGDLHIRIPVSHLQEIEQRSNSHKTTNNEQFCCKGKEDVSIKLQRRE